MIRAHLFRWRWALLSYLKQLVSIIRATLSSPTRKPSKCV